MKKTEDQVKGHNSSHDSKRPDDSDRLQREKIHGKATRKISRGSNGGTKWLLVIQMLVCVIGIYGCFGLWSVKQERIMTKPYFTPKNTVMMNDSSSATDSAENAGEVFPGMWSVGFFQALAGVIIGMATLAVRFLFDSVMALQADTSATTTKAQKEVTADSTATAASSATATPAAASLHACADPTISSYGSPVSPTFSTFHKNTAVTEVEPPTPPPPPSASSSSASSRSGGVAALAAASLPLLLVGFTNAFGSSMGYASMRLLPFPVILAAKMGKMIPVMIVGYFWYGVRYGRDRVLGGVVLSLAVYSFYMLDDSRASSSGKSHQTRSSTSSSGTGGSTITSTTAPRQSLPDPMNISDHYWMQRKGEIGLVLLLVNLIMDGVTNATQDVVVKRFQWSSPTLMVVVNACAAGWLALAMALGELPLSEWGSMLWVTPSFPAGATFSSASSSSLSSLISLIRSLLLPQEDWSRSMAFLRLHADCAYDLFVLSLVNAAGQVFIFYTITLFGSLTLTAITLMRKAGSVGLSVVVHGHQIRPVQGIALLVTLGSVVWDARISVRNAARKKQKQMQEQQLQPPSSPSSTPEAKEQQQQVEEIRVKRKKNN